MALGKSTVENEQLFDLKRFIHKKRNDIFFLIKRTRDKNKKKLLAFVPFISNTSNMVLFLFQFFLSFLN